MNAQQLINTCNKTDFNPRKFRKEMNISWLINDVRKQFNNLNKQEVKNGKNR